MKYIHKFDDLSELNNYVATDYKEPHVSLTGDDILDYNIINANGHQYVDLGLPSGTLWSTQSCGASKWGELTANNDNQENTYKFYSGSGQEYSKYNSTDGKTELDLEDDQAHIVWGGNWRIPSVEEFNELLIYTNKDYTGSPSNYNYKWKLISKFNGNYITLPLTNYSPYDFSLPTRDANTKYGERGKYYYYYFDDNYIGDQNGIGNLRYACRSNRPIIETKRTPLFGGINILPMSLYSHSNPASNYELELGDPVNKVPTSYNTKYGLQTSNSAYFNFIELGSRFSSQKNNFAVESGIIDNECSFASWRLPTVDEWRVIYGYSGNRPGSTVNGVPNKLKAWICIEGTTYGLLLFPDNFYIGGKELYYGTTYLTRAEFDHYLSQGCRFLGAYGAYKDGYGWNSYNTNVEYALADNSSGSSVNQYQRTVTNVSSSLSASDPIMVDYKQDLYTPVFLVK